jgi:hypothetical protein
LRSPASGSQLEGAMIAFGGTQKPKAQSPACLPHVHTLFLSLIYFLIFILFLKVYFILFYLE